MNDIFEDSETYVCITHQALLPCNEGQHHLVSNWITDVTKILNVMEEQDELD
jgi:hypothetical protein